MMNTIRFAAGGRHTRPRNAYSAPAAERAADILEVTASQPHEGAEIGGVSWTA
jgi:hypothetical protein